MDTIMKVRKYVIRKAGTIYSSQTQKDSGYCKQYYDRQYLIKEWSILGLVLWRKILASEDVPVHAWAQLSCLGYTDWKSKFKEYI